MKHSALRLIPFFLIVITCCSILFFTKSPDSTAADLSKFDPGRIIDDAVFYNSSSMTVDEIQRFLNSKVPVCQTETEKYPQAKAPCLKDYRETTKEKIADKYCQGYSAADQSAAEIIHGVAQSCGINPQVIIVMLQKEQSLVTDTWPRDGWLNGGTGVNYQYRSAMGYGCPDTAACDTTYYGFFNQVYHAARQFKIYQALPNSYSYVAGRNNNILWHPDRASCGSSTVFIENQATAGLYNYTPYQPNQAALGAGYGTGNYCSSYGNRNFYHFFTDWFGSTRSLGASQVINKYNQLGGENCWLGKAVSDVTVIAKGNLLQEFENGKIYWHPDYGAWTVRNGAVNNRYAAQGYENGYLGFPRSDEIAIKKNNVQIGIWQQFEGGQMYWTSETSAWDIRYGAMFNRFQEIGYENSHLGFPISTEVKIKDGVYQEFQKGRLYWRSNKSAMDMNESILIGYENANYENSYLGLPAESTKCGIKNEGCWQLFDGGKIYWSMNSGAHDIHIGAVDNKYAELKYENGALGYPTSREVPTGNTCNNYKDIKQEFQGGTVYWSACTPSSVTIELR